MYKTDNQQGPTVYYIAQGTTQYPVITYKEKNLKKNTHIHTHTHIKNEEKIKK